MHSRNNYLDFIKGVTIILVIIGHLIQFSLNGREYYQNTVFVFIYSFHMPLFMAISGYLFYYAEKKTFKDILLKRLDQLIIPLLTWSLLICIVIKFKNQENNFKDFILFYLKFIPRFYWFLPILFISTLTLYLTNRFLKKWYFHIIIIFIILLIPDFSSIKYLKFMYPFFLFGFMCNRYFSIISTYLIYILTLSAVVYISILYFWKSDYFVYFSNAQILDGCTFNTIQIKNYIIRYLAGITGSIVVLFAAKFIYSRFELKSIQALGKKTLGIYLVHLFLLELISYKQPIIIHNMFYCQVLLNSTILLITSFVIIKGLEMWNVSNRLFLGNTSEIKHEKL
jgi:fucose 4-O-acetylase-like acetyltransferase